ncbi:MAG: hypothetical protein FJ276_08435 [Planctomycetes bacterium]|nr:hypothetical protein [Planctomycetota bacterium]
MAAAFPLNSTRSDSVFWAASEAFWAAWEAVPQIKANATKMAGTEGTVRESQETMDQIRLKAKAVVIENEFHYVVHQAAKWPYSVDRLAAESTSSGKTA